MERILLKNFKENLSSSDRVNSFILVEKAAKNPIELKNGDFDLLIKDLNNNQKLVINVYEDANAKISFFAKTNIELLDVEINLFKNANVVCYFADFTLDKNKINVNAYLKEEGSSFNWHLASLTSNQDKKDITVSVLHQVGNTYAKVDNYGVCRDSGKLLFAGTSTINKGSKESRTYQNAKIMVFDKDCVATAKPVLKIDENDIQANHAAVVGKVNDEHLFYLTSRGLSENQAKEIITFGYLKPILEGFIEDEVKQEITDLIEGRK